MKRDQSKSFFPIRRPQQYPTRFQVRYLRNILYIVLRRSLPLLHPRAGHFHTSTLADRKPLSNTQRLSRRGQRVVRVLSLRLYTQLLSGLGQLPASATFFPRFEPTFNSNPPYCGEKRRKNPCLFYRSHNVRLAAHKKRETMESRFIRTR